MVWRGTFSDVWEAWRSTGWSHAGRRTGRGWMQGASAVGAAVNPRNGDQYAFWRAVNGDMQEACYENGQWRTSDVTAAAGPGLPRR